VTLKITGTVIRGEGNAASNHAVLIPVLAPHFPAIANSNQFGTVNVRLDQPLDKSRADIWTRRIIWQPFQKNERRVEIFGFINIKFECPLNGPQYDCWIILPEGSMITYRDKEAEIIANVFMETVAYGVECALHIDHMPSAVAPPSFGLLYGMSFA